MEYSFARIQVKCLLGFMLLIASITACNEPDSKGYTQTVTGKMDLDTNLVWLSHEHILVDFIGADSIDPDSWNPTELEAQVLPYLNDLKKHKVDIFVDATPNYLGREIGLLKNLSERTGLRIITNTGLYGARNNKFIPEYAKELSAEALAALWIKEYEDGISGSPIRPGFIKISVDDTLPLDPLHKKLVTAAALTHKATGLTIASHTGKAQALWPQLEILKTSGVDPSAFIWIHAQAEEDLNELLKAANYGCWISLDGMGWELENHIEKLRFARRNNFLDKVLISHDAGWYDPQKEVQTIQPYTAIFTAVYPRLKASGFTDTEWNQLISVNPAKAFQIKVRSY
ncbi:phosphotriesterase family protein [Lentiprolixibacter aurantiacus]|uniref:Phosphotriesterase n=1 Tax=Lentiprolixibacter aurantiacus TaxID=2993939 RepID=A0AAE3SNX7_9FLAO|nr:phosphotriesterase [Lentiprolixibacter aurantiacus]MCX2720015.1 phosphotriesterase [Lentiprolixibacter aurantiacus]